MFAVNFWYPASTSMAHASLEHAEPAPNTQLQSAPTEARLTFSERLENELFYIQLTDQQGNRVPTEPTQMSKNQRMLQQSLPKLTEGHYILSYKVISSDGHPIRDSYVFTIGEGGPIQHNPDVHQHHDISDLASFNFNDGLNIIIQYCSYILLLGLIGGMYWRKIASLQLLKYIGALYIFVNVLELVLLTPQYLDEWTWGEFLQFTQLSIFRLEVVSLITVALGIIVMSRHWILNVLWVLMLLITNALNGHPLSSYLRWPAVAADALHLAAASVWLAGLAILLMLLYKKHPEVYTFTLRFSQTAFWSIILIVISGAGLSLMIESRLHTFILTLWGKLLLLKVIITLFIAITGYLIRRKIRITQTPRKLLALDAGFGLFLLIIVSLITSLNPNPVNTPLSWHEMHPIVHATTDISPNIPGVNSFDVTLWVDEADILERVQLTLIPLDYTDIPPIDVPLQLQSQEQHPMQGYKDYSYSAHGAYMTMQGRWDIQLKLQLKNNDDLTYTKQQILY